jgi:hypothetical protein
MGCESTTRELAQRLNGSDEIQLLWYPQCERVEVSVRDAATASDSISRSRPAEPWTCSTIPTHMRRRLSGTMTKVDCLQDALRALVVERQALRERNAGREALESNRVEVAHRQQQLSHALIDRYGR